ncbi:MAG: DUF4112 domain-containing protein [Brevundimonas sp.]|nr:MAG: DUF4112 domain-containing protein [Brevundimonas sp.]
MAKRSIADIEKIWSNVEGVKKLSDRAIGIGPFGVGLDGLLTWIPIAGLVYSVGAGGWLMVQASRAKASPMTMARMLAYVGVDAATSEVPVIGDAIDFLFPGHLMAAKALQKDIESTHWVEANEREAKAAGAHDGHVSAMRAAGRKRLVYLHD